MPSTREHRHAALVVDLDGTLAHWRLGAKEEYTGPSIRENTYADPVTTRMVRDAHALGFDIIVLTGRGISAERAEPNAILDLVNATREFVHEAKIPARAVFVQGTYRGMTQTLEYKTTRLRAVLHQYGIVRHLGNDPTDALASSRAGVIHDDVQNWRVAYKYHGDRALDWLGFSRIQTAPALTGVRA